MSPLVWRVAVALGAGVVSAEVARRVAFVAGSWLAGREFARQVDAAWSERAR